MFEKMAANIMDNITDDLTKKMLTENYNENLFILYTATKKIGFTNVVETCLRAEQGEILSRAYGSPNHQSHWEKLFLNPVQLFQMPLEGTEEVNTEIIIGKNCKRPLKVSMPVIITGMAYGGSLSLKAKVALAKGAAMAGTATNTGESGFLKEERDAAKLLIGQYNRGGWLNKEEYLRQMDAIEVQFGQGAWGGAVPSSINSEEMDEKLRGVMGLKEGQNSYKASRMPGVNDKEEFIKLIKKLKELYDVPIGVKIAASHYIEKELQVILSAPVDFITIDGAEGGTASAPPTLSDSMGIPTIYALARATAYIRQNGNDKNVDILIAGGLRNPGEFLKALAMGAKAVYIGSVALMAIIQSQITKVIPAEPTPQLVLYNGQLVDDFDENQGADHLNKFLKSCKEEMKLALVAIGKKDFGELNIKDLVCIDRELSNTLKIDYVGEASRP